MSEHQVIDAMWDDTPVDVSEETNMIWSIANKLRGPYQSDKYKDVIIPMTIIRRFECALEPTKEKVVEQYEKNPNYPEKLCIVFLDFSFITQAVSRLLSYAMIQTIWQTISYHTFRAFPRMYRIFFCPRHRGWIS